MTLDELRAKAFNAKAVLDSGLIIGEPVVKLADARAALAECEQQQQRWESALRVAQKRSGNLERKLAAAKEALINAKCELNCLGRDLQEIYDGKRQFPTALLNLEVMDEIASALNGCE